MNFATKISIILATTVPLLLLGYSVFSVPALAVEVATPRVGPGQPQTASTESLDAGLMTAVGLGDSNRVQDYLNRGAKHNARNAQGLSALSAAAYIGNAEIVSTLLQHGARDVDGSALAYAQAGGHTHVAVLLAKAATGQFDAVPGEDKAGLEAVVTSVDRPENCLRIRISPGSSHEVVGCAVKGGKLTLTGVVRKGWAQVQSPVKGWVLSR